MQPAKPSFLEYFEQKEKEANVQKEGGDRQNNTDNRGPEGNLQVVRSHAELQRTGEAAPKNQRWPPEGDVKEVRCWCPTRSSRPSVSSSSDSRKQPKMFPASDTNPLN